MTRRLSLPIIYFLVAFVAAQDHARGTGTLEDLKPEDHRKYGLLLTWTLDPKAKIYRFSLAVVRRDRFAAMTQIRVTGDIDRILKNIDMPSPGDLVQLSKMNGDLYIRQFSIKESELRDAEARIVCRPTNDTATESFRLKLQEYIDHSLVEHE